ncbi:unnamed protein product [Dicrocoelium dendriticum]|nr:unnamed protein product [Dicrocoelium dendriticum]
MRFFLLICTLLTFLRGSQSIRNLNVSRVIDLRSPVVRIEHTLIVDAIDGAYEFSIHPSEASHLVHISAQSEKPKSPIPVHPLESKINTYAVSLRHQSTGSVRFTITTVLAKVLEPKPSEIYQNDKQFVKYSGNINFYSSYETLFEETRILLPNGELLKHTTSPAPISKHSGALVYGPYYDTAPSTYLPLHVHFESNRPFLVVKKMTRLIEISHWGNIAVEESLEVKNDGAQLKGPFSRLDFDMGLGQSVSVMAIKTALPAAAKDIYYRDEIGNISSSSVTDLLDSMEVKLSPRFPLMGGWKTQYVLGYNIPAHEFLYRSGSQFSLRMRFIDHVYDDQFVEELTLKIVLPEMVYDIQFTPPFPVQEEPRELLKTYLDTVGRTVLVFKARNLVVEHISDFVLDYRFHTFLMLREPLMLVTAFCVIFICVLIYVRLDFSIFRDEKTELRLRVQSIVDEAIDLYKRRATLYQSYEDAISQYKSSKNPSQLASDRRGLEAKHKKLNQSLASVQAKMSDLYSDGVEKLKELLTLDSCYRDLIQESVQLAERLISGKITKPQYQSSDSDMSTKKADLIGRMDTIVTNL